MSEDSGIKSPSGFPFGVTSISDDTGCRYHGTELHLSRSWEDSSKWRVIATNANGALPHQYLLDKPDGVPLEFDSRNDALEFVKSEFLTIIGINFGKRFTVKGKQYIRVKVPNMKTARNFLPVLDCESFAVSEMHQDVRPDPKTKETPPCEPSSSASAC